MSSYVPPNADATHLEQQRKGKEELEQQHQVGSSRLTIMQGELIHVQGTPANADGSVISPAAKRYLVPDVDSHQWVFPLTEQSLSIHTRSGMLK